MPTVPTYQESVGNDGGMSGRVADIPGNAFGQGLADAGQKLSGALGDYATVQDHLDAMHDEAVAKNVAVQYGTFSQQVKYGDANTAGYLSLENQDALNARANVEQQLQQKRDVLVAQAQNPRQRALITQSLGAAYNGDLQTIGAHAVAQGKSWYGVQSAATEVQDRDTYVNAITAAQTNSDPATRAVLQQDAAVARTKLYNETARGLSFNGSLSDQTLAAAMQKHDTLATGAVIDNLLSTKTAAGIGAANTYLQQNQGLMDPATRATYAAKVADQVNTQSAADAANASLAVTAPAAPVASVGGASSPLRTTPVTDRVRALLVQSGATPAEQDVLIRMQQQENATANPTLKNPGQGATSYGIWQHTDGTWKALGGTAANRSDPQAQSDLALKLLRQNSTALVSALGRQPSPSELYMAHQQGVGAAIALLKADPNANAVATLQAAHVAHPQASILNNLPKDLRPTSASTTVGQFLNSWAAKVNGTSAATLSAPGATPATNPTTGAFQGGLPDHDAMIANAVAAAPPGASAAVVQQFKAAAESKWNEMHGAQQQGQTAAWNNVQALLRDPSVTTLEQFVGKVNPAVYQSLSETQKTSLYDHFGGSGGGTFAKVDDPKAVDAMERLVVKAKAGDNTFANADLVPFRSQVTQGRWEHYRELQSSAQSNDGAFKVAHAKASDINGVMAGVLPEYGLPRNPKPNTPEANSVGELRMELLQRAEAYAQKNKESPDSATTTGWAHEVLGMQVRQRIAGSMFGVTQSDPMNYAKGVGQRVDNKPTQLFVPLSQIPAAHVTRMRQDWATAHPGIPLDPKMVENNYPRMLATGAFD